MIDLDLSTAKNICMALDRAGKKVIITKRGSDEPYLVRYIIQRSPEQSVYIHRFLSSDDATLHDHPWDARTTIIHKGYTEIVAERNEHGTWEKNRYQRKPGEHNKIDGNHIHRIQLDRDYAVDDWDAPMTLFIGGPRYKSWGFYNFFGPNYTYTDHKEYLR